MNKLRKDLNYLRISTVSSYLDKAIEISATILGTVLIIVILFGLLGFSINL